MTADCPTPTPLPPSLTDVGKGGWWKGEGTEGWVREVGGCETEKEREEKGTWVGMEGRRKGKGEGDNGRQEG